MQESKGLETTGDGSIYFIRTVPVFLSGVSPRQVLMGQPFHAAPCTELI